MPTALASRVAAKAALKSGTDWLRARAKQTGDGGDLPVTNEVAVQVEVETWLQSRGVHYAPATDIPMGLIDEKRSRANQARRDPIVAESVDRFTTAMKTGAVFPPIVAYPDAGRLVIIDGNNRQAARRRAGFDTIFGIVLAEDTPSELIHLLTVEANAHHGVTPELSWRVQQAFNLCSIGWPDTDAAEAAGLSVAQLRSARTVQEADQRARSLRLAGFADLPASSKGALAALKDDAVFFQLSKLVIQTGMTTEEIHEIKRVLRALTSETARIEHIAAVAQTRTTQRITRRAAPGKHSRVHSPKTAIAAGIGKLLAVDPGALARQVVTVHDRDALLGRLDAAEKKLALLRATLATLSNLDKG